MNDWNPDQYLDFAEERARPALDLIARVPLRRPRLVFDLGCGPGNSTSLLKQAYPAARIIGMDRSPAMIAKAKASYGGLEFVSADVSLWPGDREADLVFANALFQWLPGHLQLMTRIVSVLKRDGVLALQMPDNLTEPSHEAMREVAGQGAWAGQLARATEARNPIHTPTEYYDALMPQCSRVDIWHAAYYHEVDGTAGIISMLQSTGLKPYLDLLRTDEKADFLQRYKEKLEEAYPALHNGKTLFRFPRLFVIAQK
jgi:trans-aconitate 2-methyltransferase